MQFAMNTLVRFSFLFTTLFATVMNGSIRIFVQILLVSLVSGGVRKEWCVRESALTGNGNREAARPALLGEDQNGRCAKETFEESGNKRTERSADTDRAGLSLGRYGSGPGYLGGRTFGVNSLYKSNENSGFGSIFISKGQAYTYGRQYAPTLNYGYSGGLGYENLEDVHQAQKTSRADGIFDDGIDGPIANVKESNVTSGKANPEKDRKEPEKVSSNPQKASG